MTVQYHMAPQSITRVGAGLQLLFSTVCSISDMPSQNGIYNFLGSPFSRYGFEVRMAGDVDDDGYEDLVASWTDPTSNPPYSYCEVRSGRSGLVLLVLEGKGFRAGDVDADGFDDIAAAGDRPGGLSFARVYSGKNGRVIVDMAGPLSTGPSSHPFLPWFSPNGAGDVNGDGNDDILLGARGEGQAGVVKVLSGADWSVLYTVGGKTPGDSFGWAVEPVGDVDNDGRNDFMSGRGPMSMNPAYVRLYSGMTGNTLYEWQPLLQSSGGFGSAFRHAGDLDADGKDDVVIAEWPTTSTGALYAFSGRTGNVLWLSTAPASGGLFPSSVATAGDINADGRDDIIVGSQGGVFASGFVYVLSGRNGNPLAYWYRYDNTEFGFSVDGGKDINGDGVPDACIGSPNFTPAQTPSPAGRVEVISLGPLSLGGTPFTLGLLTGGSQHLALSARAHASAPYWLLGSLSGRRLGLSLGGINLPLNPDAYMLHTLFYPNMAPLSGSFGVLDAKGNAQASFTLPAGLPPALVGLTFDHAYVVLQGWTPVFASNAVPVTIVP